MNSVSMVDINEYEELRQLRILWSRTITTRDHIFIPAMLTLLAISLSQLPNFPPGGVVHYLFAEWIILLIAGIYWRKLSRLVDSAIVGLYGRMFQSLSLIDLH